jgi:hypothetical protein
MVEWPGMTEAVARIRGFVRASFGPSAIAQVTLWLLLLLGLAIPVAHAVRVEPLVPILLGFGLVFLASRIELSDRAARRALLACFSLFVVGQVLLCSNHVAEPFSDFRRQWLTAVEYAENGLGIPDRPQTQRAIPLYYPLVLLFGPSPTVYVVANVVMSSLTFLMTTWVARRHFGWSAAAKTSFLLLFAFEVYFANTIPTHEVPGAFGVVLFVLLLVELERLFQAPRSPRAAAVMVGLAAAASLTITWTQWQRGTGVFCIVALLVHGAAAVVRGARRGWQRLGVAALIAATSVLSLRLLEGGGLIADPSPKHFTSTDMNLLAFSSHDGDGSFDDKFRKHKLVSAMDSEELVRLSRAMFAETLRTGAVEKYDNFLSREVTLLRFGKTSVWYFRGATSARWISISTLRAAYESARVYVSPVLWAIALLTAVAALRSRDVLLDHRLSPLVVMLAFLTVIGALGESQTRYSFFLVYLISIYAGSPWLLDRSRAEASGGQPAAPRWPLRVAQVAASVAAVAAVVALLVAAAPHLHGVSLANFGDARIAVAAGPARPHGRARPAVTVEQNLLTIRDPSVDSSDLTVTATEDLVARAGIDNVLRFVVANTAGDNGKRGSKKAADLVVPGRSLRVFIDGRPAQVVDLSAGAQPRAVSIAGIAYGRHRVKLELALGDTAADPRRIVTTVAYLGFY